MSYQQDSQNLKRAASSKRRDLLKKLTVSGSALAASGFLPQRWTRPVVQAVVLPAHAEATGVVEYYGQVVAEPTNNTQLAPGRSSLIARIFNGVIPAAHAQSLPNAGRPHTLCATDNGDGTVSISFINRAGTQLFRGTLMRDGTPGSIFVVEFGPDTCGDDTNCWGSLASPIARPARILSIGGGSITVELDRCSDRGSSENSVYVITVDEQPCSLPSLVSC